MRHREWARDLICLGLLILAVTAFFWPLIAAGAWIPRGGGDLVSFLWPMYNFAARSVRSGTVPLWNPHLHSGAPFVADNQSGLFYPVNLLTFAIFGPPSYAVMQGLVALHIWLAAATMFALLRGLGLRQVAALLGGLAFALSDLFITHLGNLNLNATAAWLPLVLWFTHRALTRERAGWAAAAGITLALAALAGHAQLLLFVALTIALYVVYHLGKLVVARSRPLPRRAARTIGLASLIAAIGVGGAALTLLPAYELAGHTGRGHLPYDEATRYSLPPRALIGLAAPGFYGRGPADFWGPWERVEVGYAGVGTLILAAFALLAHVSRSPLRPPSAPRREDDPDDPSIAFPMGFFALLVPLAFVLAMGRYTPVYRLLYNWFPTFDQIRAPARLVVLANLGLAALAAYGLHSLGSRPATGNRQSIRPRTDRWIGIAAAVAAVLLVAVGLPHARSLPPPDRITQATRSVVVAATLLALNGFLIVLVRRRAWIVWVLPLLLAVDLIALGSTTEIERHDPTRGFDHPQVVSYLERDASLFRIENTAAAWQPDAALMHGLYDIGGVYNPLTLAPYEAYRWAVGQRGSPRYNLLGVKYVLADKGVPPGDEGLVPIYTAAPDIDVYLNPAALPRALFVTSPHVVSDHEAAWQAIHDTAFDPARTVVLEEGQLPVPPQDDGEAAVDSVATLTGSTGDQDQPTRVTVARYDSDAIELTVETPSAGWLVLSDVYYPGWRATVDAEETPVLRANYTFRAVQVPAGAHTVEMAFTPWTWRVGLTLSLGTWLAVAVAAALGLRARVRTPI